MARKKGNKGKTGRKRAVRKSGASRESEARSATAKEVASATAEPGPRLWLYLVPPLIIAAAYLILANVLGWSRGAEPEPISGTAATVAVSGDALDEAPQLIARALTKKLAEAPVSSPRFGDKNHGIYLAFRRAGSLVADGWRDGGNVREAVTALASALVKAKPKVTKANTVELCLTHSYRQLDRNRRSAFSNIHRGVRGLEIETPSGTRRISPTTMIARNFKFDRALEYLAKQAKLRAADIADESIRTFECDQILVDIAAGTAITMYRGNQVIELSEITRERTEKFRDGLIAWLANHVHPDGRMTYKWWPSQGSEAKSNNMIRQWMATAALNKSAHDRGDQHLFDLAETNIDYNLAQFYKRDPSGHGYILFNNKAKLGAMALAAFSIYIHPKRKKWASYEDSILTTINSLLQSNGRYSTFYVPKGRNDNENFYPGETQLYLATRYVDERDPDMLERIMRAFRYYRQWHRDNRNPAFIPWHTQAYFALWQVTKDKELADFVFEMNDWLIKTMQQWDEATTPDARGRFYSATRRYGPPHASSTGVYLEGLIDAYQLAREVGDETRRLRYARAMVRGLRSSIQLQFVDDVDMFYIRKKDRVVGGMRTTIYDNVIRVDNVQHTLMGVLKIVDEVSDADWRHGMAE